MKPAPVRALAGLAVLAALVLAPTAAQGAPAPAAAAPDVFVRDLDVNNHPVGDWMPLNGAQMSSIFGQQLGVKLQATSQPNNAQRILAEVVSVPDGKPDQKDVYSLCFPKSGAVGTIVALDSFTHYEGNGPYTLKFTATTGTDASNCAGGPVTQGAFSITARATLKAVGRPLLIPVSLKSPFAGADVASPLGASRSQVMCARDARVNADGSLSGTLVKVSELSPAARYADDLIYPKAGVWRCVARGKYENATPWTPPTAPTLVQDDYRGIYKPLGLTRLGGGRVRLTAFPYPIESAAGATVAMTATRVVSCNRQQVPTLSRRGAHVYRSRLGGRGRVSFTMRFPLPRAGELAIYALHTRMTGARLVRPETIYGLALHLDRQDGRLKVKFGSSCG